MWGCSSKVLLKVETGYWIWGKHKWRIWRTSGADKKLKKKKKKKKNQC